MPVQICIAIFLAATLGFVAQRNTSHRAEVMIVPGAYYNQTYVNDNSNIMVLTAIAHHNNRIVIIDRRNPRTVPYRFFEGNKYCKQ